MDIDTQSAQSTRRQEWKKLYFICCKSIIFCRNKRIDILIQVENLSTYYYLFPPIIVLNIIN